MGGKGSMAKEKSVPLHPKEKTAWLFFRVGSSVDDDTVAWVEWGHHFFDFDPVGARTRNPTREGATFFSEASVNELLVIDAMKPTREKASAKGHLQTISVFGRSGLGLSRHGLVDGLAVDRGDGGDVVGGFEAPLNLERVQTELDEFGDLVHGGEILGG